MPVETFPDGQEPEDPTAPIWRFMEMWKFRDLIETGELYFRRADLFPNDELEGIPTDEYAQHVLRLHPLDVRDRRELDHSIGSMALNREAHFVCCWSLFTEETVTMWSEFGKDGVAICSRYDLLKAALETCHGRPHLGRVRYGTSHLTGWNVLRFISTKRERFAHEREVRALLWMYELGDGRARHFDLENRPHRRPLPSLPSPAPQFQRRKVDLQALMTGIVVTPWASTELLTEVKELTRRAGYTMPVRASELAEHQALLPDRETMLRLGFLS